MVEMSWFKLQFWKFEKLKTRVVSADGCTTEAMVASAGGSKNKKKVVSQIGATTMRNWQLKTAIMVVTIVIYSLQPKLQILDTIYLCMYDDE